MEEMKRDFGDGLRKVREGKGLKQVAFANKTGVSRESIIKWESGKFPRGPYLVTLWEMVEKADLDRHTMAHISFNLPAPGEMDELEGDLKELCDLITSMTDEERANLLASIKRYAESKNNLFSLDKAAEPKSKYRGGDTIQAPPVAEAGGG